MTFTRSAFILLSFIPAAFAADPQLIVYKTATCGCCGKWAEHMKEKGFDVKVNDVPSTAPYRQKYGVPDRAMSCHTAVVGDYAVEGHVPAADVHRLLERKPKVKGIAVPGMPIGSPGMEQGPRQDAYSVVSFDSEGRLAEFQKYPAK